jgi:hypothetical protein
MGKNNFANRLIDETFSKMFDVLQGAPALAVFPQ